MVLVSMLAGMAGACPAAGTAPFYATSFERKPSADELGNIGRALFFDPGLSASGKMACASCHDPKHAYGPPNALAVQLGGTKGKTPGLRAVPSLMYRQTTPPFSEHFFDNDGDDSFDQGPTGGFAWDGRAASAHEQAELPLLSPFEMGNKDRASALVQLAASSSAAGMKKAFGEHLFADPERAWTALLFALEVFQQSPADFYPFRSRYDAFLRGQEKLSPAEQRGLAVFNDKAKGNCAACHISAVKRGAFPLFTDMGLIALAVPRNPAIAANRDPKFFDLGLCGPLRTDYGKRTEYCGLFKTPSLRNVATRKVFFHNGVMHRLEDAVRFYVQRDARPGRVYPHGRSDDLPEAYRSNVNIEQPFGQKPGDRPSLSETEITDIVAFLGTLTDR